MCFLNFYTLVFWIPLVPIHILIGPVLESVLVLAVQILGPFGPPKKCVNFDMFKKDQKCVFCILTPSHLTQTN